MFSRKLWKCGRERHARAQKTNGSSCEPSPAFQVPNTSTCFPLLSKSKQTEDEYLRRRKQNFSLFHVYRTDGIPEVSSERFKEPWQQEAAAGAVCAGPVGTGARTRGNEATVQPFATRPGAGEDSTLGWYVPVWWRCAGDACVHCT